MTREPFIAHSELTNEIYIVVGKEKYRVTEQAIRAVMAIKALEQEPITVETINQYCKEHNYILCEKGTDHGKMLVCPNCGLDVHSDFENCPRCGERMKNE